MAQRPHTFGELDLGLLHTDPGLAEILENIEREKTPERLLTLARELQQLLTMKRQRETPN